MLNPIGTLRYDTDLVVSDLPRRVACIRHEGKPPGRIHQNIFGEYICPHGQGAPSLGMKRGPCPMAVHMGSFPASVSK
eukprot:1161404-Pelagomonas_calceolata.AAC.2